MKVAEEDVMEGVKKTVTEGKKGLEKAETALRFLEAMEIDTKQMRKDYEDVKGRISKMEKAYTAVTGKV